MLCRNDEQFSTGVEFYDLSDILRNGIRCKKIPNVRCSSLHASGYCVSKILRLLKHCGTV
jgi:hypothetical protein